MEQRPAHERLEPRHGRAREAPAEAGPERIACAGAGRDKPQGDGRRGRPEWRTQQPPDGQAHRHPVQDDGGRQRRSRRLARGVGAQGDPVQQRVEREAHETQDQGRDVRALGGPVKEVLRDGGTRKARDHESDGDPPARRHGLRQHTQQDQATDGHEDEPVEGGEEAAPTIGESVGQRAEPECGNAGEEEAQRIPIDGVCGRG